jgi:hypothetical protein
VLRVVLDQLQELIEALRLDVHFNQEDLHRKVLSALKG